MPSKTQIFVLLSLILCFVSPEGQLLVALVAGSLHYLAQGALVTTIAAAPTVQTGLASAVSRPPLSTLSQVLGK